MKLPIYTAAVLTVVAGVAIATSAFKDSDPEQRVQPLPVALQPLQPVEQFLRARTFSGTVQASRRAELAFERSARLSAVMVDEGDRVQAGQSLAELDSRQLRIRIKQTTAQLQSQQAVLDELQSGARREVIAAARANVRSLQAQADLRKKTLDRALQLYRKDSISAQMRDEASDSYAAATARTAEAEARLAELENGIRKEKVVAQQASVEALRQQLASLQTDLDDSLLRAPFSGTVVRRMVDEGTMVGVQQPVLELLETGQLEAHIGIPLEMVEQLKARQSRSSAVAEGAETSVGSPAADYDYVLRTGRTEVLGTLKTVVPQIDAATRTQTVIIRLQESANSQVVDGQLVKLDFVETVRVPEHHYQVPAEALVSGANGLWAVYVFEPDPDQPDRGVGVVRRSDVERLSTTGDQVIVRAMNGAFEGDERIVVTGTHRVSPGRSVRDGSALAPEQGE
ncbi:MAG: efflux RND transporter periplasmic adaptor subunit [Planctomycetaceae bacterium]|nr:efflux RND transporter periplasmic adaptor subunit [Planctomycetaceae bacterium]